MGAAFVDFEALEREKAIDPEDFWLLASPDGADLLPAIQKKYGDEMVALAEAAIESRDARERELVLERASLLKKCGVLEGGDS